MIRELRELKERLARAERGREALATRLAQATKVAARTEKRTALTEARLRAALEEIAALKAATPAEQRDSAAKGPEGSTGRKETAPETTPAAPELEHSTLRAAETSRAKSALLANVTQNLQGPIEHIIQAVQELITQGVKEEGQEAIETLLNAADLLARALEDMVGFAHLEPVEMALSQTPLDLWSSVEEVGRLVAHRAQRKGLEVVVDADPVLARARLGDAVRLRQVLLNLANNAVKFTRCGRVEISATPTEGDLVRLAVLDTGCGMTAAVVDQLLYGGGESEDKSEVQPGGATTRGGRTSESDASGGGAGGAMTRVKKTPGLGLAVSRQIVRRMGGTLRIESEIGRGTTVSFVVPLPPTTDSPAPLGFDLRGATFLVAEPHARTRAILCAQITRWGGVARPIIRADRSLARLREARVAGRPVAAAIFGFVEDNAGVMRLKEAVRRDADLCATHLILMAPIAHLGQYGQQGGFEAILAKPVRQRELQKALATAAGISTQRGEEIAAERKPRRAETREAGEAGEAGNPSGTGNLEGSGRQRAAAGGDGAVSAATGQVLVVVEAEAAQKAIRDYLHSRNLRTHVVDSGPKALDVVERSDFDLILIDCELTGMDGFATSTAIRTMEEQGVIRHPAPIIGIVPSESRDAEERCRRAGIDGCLPRPVHRQSLDRYLRAFLAS
jgi:signal transduction histidine kinase/CheY-like chemotaxis protein